MVSSADVVSGAIGLVAGGGLATLKYALDRRGRRHEDLWSRRFDPYRTVWALTSQFSRWPRQRPSRQDVLRLHEEFRRWFYREGGILMSARARQRYEYVQEGLAVLGQRNTDIAAFVDRSDYDEMMVVMSRFRTALTDDLESRRKRSIVLSVLDSYADRRIRRELDRRLGRLRAAGPAGDTEP